MTAAGETPQVKMHLSINVSDLNRSIEFYKAFFGVDPHKVRLGYAKQDKVWAHDPDGNEWEVYVVTDELLSRSIE